MRLLAVLPFIGILVGTPFFNRVTPLVLGLPLILAWLLLWILLTSAIMALIYRADPANRRPDPASPDPANADRAARVPENRVEEPGP